MVLSPWITNLTGAIWNGSWANNGSANVMRMVRHDLKRAENDYVSVDATQTSTPCDQVPIIVGTFGVHPLKAKDLARHPTITLTVDIYAHLETEWSDQPSTR